MNIGFMIIKNVNATFTLLLFIVHFILNCVLISPFYGFIIVLVCHLIFRLLCCDCLCDLSALVIYAGMHKYHQYFPVNLSIMSASYLRFLEGKNVVSLVLALRCPLDSNER